MITRRDLVSACIAAGATLCAVVIYAQTPVMQSRTFDWDSVAARATAVGSVRQVFRTPTATLDELEYHITTLNPGESPHAPHKHPNEELIIVKEGTVEVLSNGEWKKVGVGGLIFNASNQLHGLKNIGTGPATYHVINWSSPGMKNKADK